MIITNEIEPLSNDLTTITTEIKSYQNIAGRSIFEIGRRLSWVKKNNLVHGDYLSWLSTINIEPRQAQRFIKVATELPNTTTWSHLGGRVLYEIATLPEEEQQEVKRQVEQGNDPTVKQITDLKKRLKQKEQELAERDETIANQNDELEEHRKTELELNKTLQERPRPETKTVVKEVQVKPDDYESIKQENTELHKRHKALADELDKKDEELKDYADIASENRKVLHWQNKGKLSAYKLSSSIRDFISSSYMSSEDREAVESAGKEAQQKLNEQLNDLQRWLDDMRQLTNGRHIVEGEIINE